MAFCKYYIKNGNAWEQTFETEEPARVYNRLASAIFQKYIWKAPYIGRVTDAPDYPTGHRIITIYYHFETRKAKEIYNVEI